MIDIDLFEAFDDGETPKGNAPAGLVVTEPCKTGEEVIALENEFLRDPVNRLSLFTETDDDGNEVLENGTQFTGPMGIDRLPTLLEADNWLRARRGFPPDSPHHLDMEKAAPVMGTACSEGITCPAKGMVRCQDRCNRP